MSINQRFDTIIKELYGGNKRAFAIASNIAPTVVENVVGARQGNPSYEVLEKIICANENIEAEWLLTGRGEMLKSKEKYTPIYTPFYTPIDENSEKSPQIQLIHTPPYRQKISDTEIPLYDIDAAANLKTLFDNKTQNIIDTLKIPNLPKCDGAIHIRGDSMYPLLKAGDIVIYKEIYEFQSVVYGEMYLVNFIMDDDDYLVVKYVKRSSKKGCIQLVSYNIHHDPMDILVNSIRAMALVKASVRLNTIV